ncbi:MAG: ABC transporter substrate-binding protein [Culicoidibacterales bacterium]
MKKGIVALVIGFLSVLVVSNMIDESWNNKEITIRYANWNLGTIKENNIERQMIAAFEEENPNIDVIIVEDFDPKNWEESLTTAAKSESMPDVFMLNSVPEAMKNGWVYDISKLAKKDKNWQEMPEVVREAITYDKKITAIPFAQHFLGYMVNEELFRSQNLSVPKFGLKLEDFETAVKNITDTNSGRIAFEDAGVISDWYPSALSNNYGYYTYNNGLVSLDSSEYIAGINKAEEYIRNGYVYNSLTAEQKLNFSGKDGYEAWINGQVAFKWEGTWAAKSLLNDTPFETSFIGIPGGRNIIVNDYLGISATTEHAKAAYEFSKFMSFSAEGYQKRIDLAVENNTTINSLPLINDDKLIEAYMEVTDFKGIKEAYKNIENAYVEGLKTVPGYLNARYSARTGMKINNIENATIEEAITSAQRGIIQFEKYAEQLNELANKQLIDAKSAMTK